MAQTDRPPSPAESSSAAWTARDEAVVWHPFTQHTTWAGDEPTVVASAEGPWLTDVDGRRLLDGVSSLWTTTVGHCHPRVNEEVKRQLDTLDHATFLGSTHRPGIELSEMLVERAPRSAERSLEKVFYAGDGSSAVEVALKMAYQFSAQSGRARPDFVRLQHAYHGDTLGAVSVGGHDLFHSTYKPLLLTTVGAASPGDRANGPDRVAHAEADLERIMAERGEDVCAIIVEPLMQGAAGMFDYDASYLRTARRLADEHGALLIFDEVATGIGRTGSMWAANRAGVVPDMLTLGKGVTAGYLPLSAVLTSQRVYDAFLARPGDTGPRTFFHGHTYTANPICCAAAIANLKVMEEEGVLDQAAALGERLGGLLDGFAGDDRVAEVRRVGTMTGVEVADQGPRTGFDVCQAAREHGVWLRPLGNTVILMPPLNLGVSETELMIEALAKGLDDVFGGR
ncbi:adenosylmethionine--8-amino-7-oxononanoate transaminase [Salininema proteolyticum]|uniref:Adenosylmethionine-8-amino-7-oxononanoate aminotransferase n=1 Tax=Salininema proteolyticum TaxID=1607685 RepID=A0ABV8U2N9_9ACTN